MCGRYSLSRPIDVLAELFDADAAPGLAERYTPSFNIAPTSEVVGLAAPDGRRVLDLYRWGLAGGRLFNARAEGLSSRPAFAEALSRRRLVLVADGFFEWRPPEPGQPRQPLFFRRADGAPLALAGLRGPNAAAALWEARPVPSCTMITTSASADLDGVHDRMPVILEPDALDRWLDPASGNTHAVEPLLRPALDGTLVHHPVDPRVGDVRNNGPELVAPFESEALRLFTFPPTR